MAAMVVNIALHEWARAFGAHMVGGAVVLASQQELDVVVAWLGAMFG